MARLSRLPAAPVGADALDDPRYLAWREKAARRYRVLFEDGRHFDTERHVRSLVAARTRWAGEGDWSHPVAAELEIDLEINRPIGRS